MTLASTSITATAQVSKIDTGIVLPKSILKKAIVDIEKGDGYKAENKVLYENIRLLNSKSSVKDSIITKYVEKEKIYTQIVDNSKQIEAQHLQIEKILNDEIVKQKRKNTLNKILYSSVALGLGALLIIK